MKAWTKARVASVVRDRRTDRNWKAERGAISVAFVRPSVCLSVRRVVYIANNSRTQRPSVPQFEGRFSTLDATRVSVSGQKGQRSRSPGPLMLTHIVRHIFRMWTYSIPLSVVVEVTFGVFIGNFVSICTKLARSILIRDWNIVTEHSSRKSLFKSRILSP